MHLDLSDEETAALAQELHDIVENDRYPFSPRIRTLRGILAKLRPEPVRKPLPPKVNAPARTLYVLDYLADPTCAKRPGDALCADYRLLCSGSVYRRTEGEWYKNEGARFLLDPPLLLYAASRPFDEYPLELVLRLTVARVEETHPGRWGDVKITATFHPDDEVARDLAALLTVLCRRLITVMGKSAERLAEHEYPEFDRIPLPIAHLRRVYWPPYPPTLILGLNSQEIEDNNPPPTPVDPDRLTALLLGLPRLEHAKSIVASARLYALALELIREQPDIAYQLLVSSAETIANETLQDFQPDDEAKVEHQQRVFKLAEKFGLEDEMAQKLALEACKTERWVKRKFRKFLTDNIDASALEKEDNLFRVPLNLLPQRDFLEKTLGKIYDARSGATHWGHQFPMSASSSGGPKIPSRVAMAQLSSDFPPVAWFERIVNTAIRTFWARSIGGLSGASSSNGGDQS
jgi:hypothetical protein